MSNEKEIQVIHIGEFSYVIDKSKPIKDGDWFYNKFADNLYTNGIPNKISNNSTNTGREMANTHKTHYVIVYSDNPKLSPTPKDV